MGVLRVLVSATCFEGQCCPPPTGGGGGFPPSRLLRAGSSRRGKFAVSAARGWKRQCDASVPLFSPESVLVLWHGFSFPAAFIQLQFGFGYFGTSKVSVRIVLLSL